MVIENLKPLFVQTTKKRTPPLGDTPNLQKEEYAVQEGY